MKKGLVVLFLLSLLVLLSDGAKYEISIKQLLISSKTDYDKAFKDNSNKITCGKTINISEYDPPYLYIEVTGKKLDHKNGIINGNKTLTFNWNKDSKKKGRYKPPNTFNPVNKVKVAVYSNSKKTDEKDSEECKFKLYNNWKCSTYVGKPCTINVPVTEIYVSENGGVASVDYSIVSTLDEKYSSCGCRKWNVNVSGAISKVTCNKNNSFKKHTITKTLKLTPNNASFPEYTLSGFLTTTHKLETYDVLNCAGNHKIYVNNPPKAPHPEYPSNNSVVYYSKTIGCYAGAFTWKGPDDWGWIKGVNPVPQIYTIDILGNSNTKINISENVEAKTNYTPLCLTEGNYTWKISANPDKRPVSSQKQHFYVCAVNKIDEMNIIEPRNEEYIGTSVTLSWDKPKTNTECAPESEYSYLVSIKKDGTTTTHTKYYNEPELALNLEEGTYDWKVETIGPAEESSSSSEYRFHVCTKKKTSSPRQFGIKSKEISIVCLEENGNHNLIFNWTEPEDVGKQCVASAQKIKYRMELHNPSSKLYDYADVTSEYKADIPCVSSNYGMFLYADNGIGDSDPAMYNFTVCAKRKPGKPEVHSSSVVNHCSSKTEISWTHEEWGSSCNDNKKKMFKIVCKKDGREVPYTFFPESFGSNYKYNATLSGGTWEVSISACTLDGEFCSESGVGTVSASVIPEIIDPSASNDGHSITFSWITDDDFISCAAGNGFSYKLAYYVNGIEKSSPAIEVTKNPSYSIDIIYESIEWTIKLSSPYDAGISTDLEQYSANDDCVIVEPKWLERDKALIKPVSDSVVFGNVTFEWNKASSFGIACKEDETATTRSTNNYVKDDDAYKCYTVNVSGAVYTVNYTATSLTEKILTYGKHTWSVTAHNGNVSLSTPSKTFCLANDLPDFEIVCPYGPYLGTLLNWTSSKDFEETCGQEYGYYIKHNGEVIANTKEKFIQVPEKYLGDNFTWSVEAYVGDTYSAKQSCTTYLCVIKKPQKPIIESNTNKVVNKYGEWTFSWINGNDYDSMCGINTSFSYEVNVTLNDVLINSSFINDTNITFEFGESGSYSLSVRIYDGISYSESESAKLDLCIPSFIEKPNLISPKNGQVLLSDVSSSLKWDGITSSSTQCGSKTTYTLYYWKDGETPTEIDIGESRREFPLGILSSSATYHWNITISSSHWNVASETREFSVCTPSTPPAPVLESYKRASSSDFTLAWNKVDFGELCALQDSTSYNVYFFKNGDNYDSARSVTTTSPNYTLKDLTDGEYQFVVEAVNYKYVSDPSKPMNISVCIPTYPGKPTLWYPRESAILPINDGISFEVVPQLNEGSQCKASLPENGEESSVASSRSYQLFVNGEKVNEFYEGTLNTTESLSKQIYRFSKFNGLVHGNNVWKVVYTNSDGLSESSDSFFYGCEKPQAPRNTYPFDNEAFERFELNLTWEIDQNDFGFKCINDNEISSEQIVRVYLDVVNITEVMEEQNVTDPDDIDYTLLTPVTIVDNVPFINTQKYTLKNADVGATYIWRTETFNGFDTESSETRMFSITADYCRIVKCGEHGNCSTELRRCICEDGYMGDLCDVLTPKSKGNSVLGPALGGSLGGIVLIAIIIALILFIFMRKSGRKRVVLEGPGGDIRFSHVKVPTVGRDAPDEETAIIEQRIREDCGRLQNGVEPDEALVFAKEFRTKIKSESIDESVKAVLYTYYKFGCGRELLKFFISGEINKAQKPETLFRQNSPASTMFKHWSKIIGLDYLFACFSDILKGLIQHEVDAANDRKSDVSLQLFNDTCEVDPSKIRDDEDVEQLLAVNAIQLSLTVQRFATQIYRSVTKIPYEIKDICIHIYNSIEAAYPGHGVRGVSAFLFLRFYTVSISVPEVYGLLKDPPSSELRRTLVLVSKVLQVMSLGNKFGDKEEFMKQFNTLVEENKDKMDTFYKSVLDKNKQCEGIKPDVKVPSDIYKDSLLLMNYLMNADKKKNSAPAPAPAQDVSQELLPPTPPPSSSQDK